MNYNNEMVRIIIALLIGAATVVSMVTSVVSATAIVTPLFTVA
jgi:hypothetical protein